MLGPAETFGSPDEEATTGGADGLSPNRIGGRRARVLRRTGSVDTGALRGFRLREVVADRAEAFLAFEADEEVAEARAAASEGSIPAATLETYAADGLIYSPGSVPAAFRYRPTGLPCWLGCVER